MTPKTLWRLGIFTFLAFLLWGPAFSNVIKWINPQAGQLTVLLINKGLFAIALVLAMLKWGGLQYHGLRRIRSWWFLLPGAPFLLMAALLIMNPEARWGLGLAAVLSWIAVSMAVSIGEEGVFRGVLWRALENRGMLATSLLTSLLFGASHLMGLFTSFPPEIIASQAVFAAGVGMMLAAVRLVSGSLLAPLILHAVFDAAALVSAGGLQDMLTDAVSVPRLLVPGLLFFSWGLACVLVIQARANKGIQGAREASASAPRTQVSRLHDRPFPGQSGNSGSE